MGQFGRNFRLVRTLCLAFGLITVAGAFATSALKNPDFPVWNDGSHCSDRPDVEAVWLDGDTAVLRESLCVTAEAPFLFLLFGSIDVLLIDSGDGAPGTPAAIQRLLAEHRAHTGRISGQLIVAHTHAHGDHTRGDAALHKSGARVIGLSPEEVASYFSIPKDGSGWGSVELGDRLISVVAIPGHEASHVAFHDPRTGYLFTGDTLYPGRLYVPRAVFSTYQASVRRLQAFASANNVTAFLGAHVEMSTSPGVDFPFATRPRLNEHPLPLARAQLDELVAATDEVASAPRAVRRDHFVLTPLP